MCHLFFYGFYTEQETGVSILEPPESQNQLLTHQPWAQFAAAAGTHRWSLQQNVFQFLRRSF